MGFEIPFHCLGSDSGFLVLSGFGLYKVGTEFLPATDEGFVSVSVKLPNGSSPQRQMRL